MLLFLVLLLAVVSGVMTLAPHYEWAWRVTARILTAVKFRALIKDRDRHCGINDVWRVPELALNIDRIKRGLRVIRSDNELEQIQTPNGPIWIPAGDRVALAEELAEEAEGEYGTGDRGVGRGDTVLDCGANVGVFTREALRRGAARVVAIEPAPWALECLRRNFSDEIRQGRVVLCPNGVWDHDDTLNLTIPSGMASTAATVALKPTEGRAVVAVQLTTIDKIVAELGLNSVDFIKMDIEGAEPNALRGAAWTVQKFRPRMAISLEHRPTDPEILPRLAQRLWPNYQTECGACTMMNGHLQPVIMYARPAPR
jgi:FkbM family methyltransferase